MILVMVIISIHVVIVPQLIPCRSSVVCESVPGPPPTPRPPPPAQ